MGLLIDKLNAGLIDSLLVMFCKGFPVQIIRYFQFEFFELHGFVGLELLGVMGNKTTTIFVPANRHSRTDLFCTEFVIEYFAGVRRGLHLCFD